MTSLLGNSLLAEGAARGVGVACILDGKGSLRISAAAAGTARGQERVPRPREAVKPGAALL